MNSLIRFILLVLIAHITFSHVALSQGSRLGFDRDTHNFGQIKEENGLISTRFTLQNLHTDTIHISKVYKECGCTTPVIDNEWLSPGQSTDMLVQFDPDGRPGPFTRAIGLSGPGLDTVYTVYITGEVIPDAYPVKSGILYLKQRMLDFGRLWHDQTDTAWIEVKNDQKETLTISKPEAMPIGTRLINLPHQLAPGEEAQIGLVWDVAAGNYWTQTADHFTLPISAESVSKLDQQFYFKANIEENFASTLPGRDKPASKLPASKVDLGTVAAGEQTSYDLTIENTGTAPLLLRKIKSTCSCLKITSSTDKVIPGDKAVVRLDYTAPADLLGEHYYIGLVALNDPAQPQWRLTVKAMVEPEAAVLKGK
ncbi:DUF1573 domain-containing protein [Roseivirga sp. BDSF3-8]|uniref:DUF1573 domain-containing protein n=1 Tax=Roseivirga sp. BDSF3-8 TaxID=3241598 RepID=UPI003532769C